MQPSVSRTFGQKVNLFNAGLEFDGKLPEGFAIMNPFRENECAMAASTAFYNKYYNDNKKRGIILGINPGRFGAGITGVPFTDPKRLAQTCGIHIPACRQAHEPSSVFVYRVIELYGGLEKFYGDWYINSICPLGFLKTGKKPVNANYYDSAALSGAATPFIIKTLEQQLEFGIYTEECFCMGKGKNSGWLQKLNKNFGFFGRIVPLEHPRFIVQYKSSEMDRYAEMYVDILKKSVSRRPGN